MHDNNMNKSFDYFITIKQTFLMLRSIKKTQLKKMEISIDL